MYKYEAQYYTYEQALEMPNGLPTVEPEPLPLASDLLAPRDEYGQVIGAGW